MKNSPKIFISYTREDKFGVEELRKHLRVIERTGKADIFYDAEIRPGEDWDKRIKEELDNADIVLFIISANFLASDYAYGVELKHTLERVKKGQTRVIPVLFRDCAWKETEFAQFQVVPSNGVPIFSSRNSNPDEGFAQIAQAVKYVIDDIVSTVNIEKSQVHFGSGDNIIGDRNVIFLNKGDNIVINAKGDFHIGDLENYDVSTVFPLSGVPTLTFVEPVSFKKLISSIKHKGRGIIIEGPSGIGKTTAVKKATERLNLNEKDCTYLTARDKKNFDKIKTIADWHEGIVIIDDFHRLDEKEKEAISDYLKYLADVETSTKKLIVIGIPNTGAKLISFGHDLATRIDIFEFSKIDSQRISELIEKGENALNIKFDKKTDIILASNGSLSITQFLCHYSAIQEDIFETEPVTKIIYSNLTDVISSVRKVVSRKFDDFVFSFAQLGGSKDKTCIKLLKEIAQSENGTVNLERLQNRKPELENGISRLINEKQIEDLWIKTEECKNFLFYDEITTDLVIDDPQLLFYLNYTSEDVIANLSGKKEAKRRDKVFISYSHKDILFFERIMVHLKPLFGDGNIDVWSDKRIKPGEKWNKEIEKALEVTKVAILIISADFIASDYINQKELPELIKANYAEGATIIPLFLKPANLSRFENVTQYQGVNSPAATIIDLNENEQEKVFVKLSQRVEELYKINA